MKSMLSRLYRCIPFPLARLLLWALHPKFNFGAAGFFLTPDNKLLLLNHVYRHRYPWDLPGGYLNRGESPEAGMLRELKEETGLDGVIERILCLDQVDRFQKEVVFVGRVDPTQAPRLSHEIFELAYVPLDALPAGMLPRHAALVTRLSASSPR